MARLNPLIETRPTRRVFHREIRHGQKVSDFWLRALDTTQKFTALQIATDKTALYITGTDKKDAIDFPPVGGECVEGLSEALFQTVSSVFLMQSDADEEGRPVPDAPYTFDEMVGMTLTSPSIWSGLMEFAAEVTTISETDSKNG